MCLWLQASFDPPGLTVAVKKDRAVETMLVQGNKFNVSVLAQGNEKVQHAWAACVALLRSESNQTASRCALFQMVCMPIFAGVADLSPSVLLAHITLLTPPLFTYLQDTGQIAGVT